MRIVLLLCLAVAALTAPVWAQRATSQSAVERAPLQLQVPAPPQPDSKQISIVLIANQLWLPTGTFVQAGDTLAIGAQGRWSAITQSRLTNAAPQNFVGPDGYPQTTGYQGALLQTANVGALIGRIGENGAPFLIGSSFQGAADSDGQLFVSMNENPGAFADNQGRLAIGISLTPAPLPDPVPEPAPQTEDPSQREPSPGGARGEPERPEAQIPLPVIVLGGLGGLFALILLFGALFGRPPQARGARNDAAPPASVTARIATDGVHTERLAITVRSGP
jgi:hypothetical protein